MFKLPKKVKKKWVAALRSGKYEQGKRKLFIPAIRWDGNKDLYCCLGVAVKCELTERNDSLAELVNPNFLPIDTQHKLTTFNDVKGCSFNWIASYIERYL